MGIAGVSLRALRLHRHGANLLTPDCSGATSLRLCAAPTRSCIPKPCEGCGRSCRLFPPHRSRTYEPSKLGKKSGENAAAAAVPKARNSMASFGTAFIVAWSERSVVRTSSLVLLHTGMLRSGHMQAGVAGGRHCDELRAVACKKARLCRIDARHQSTLPAAASPSPPIAIRGAPPTQRYVYAFSSMAKETGRADNRRARCSLARRE